MDDLYRAKELLEAFVDQYDDIEPGRGGWCQWCLTDEWVDSSGYCSQCKHLVGEDGPQGLREAAQKFLEETK